MAGQTYSYGQLETLWLNTAKGTRFASRAWAQLMAAIAEAESGGQTDAHNPSGASGLWQILGAPTGWTGSTNWFDPIVNARAALAKLQTQGLGAWVTYTDGSYRQYLRPGVNPASLPTTAGASSSSGSSTGGGGGGGLLGIPGEIIGFFSDLDHWIGEAWQGLVALFSPSTYVRVAAGLLGAGLLAFGLFALAKAVM